MWHSSGDHMHTCLRAGGTYTHCTVAAEECMLLLAHVERAACKRNHRAHVLLLTAM
jgi:hypothetical protein